MNILVLCFSFIGRIGRVPFIVAFVGVKTLFIGFVLLFVALTPARSGYGAAPNTEQVALGLVFLAVVVFVQNAVMAKRLHDIGRSGGWAPILYFGSMATGLLGLRPVGLLLILGSLVWLALTPGQPCANRYGPQPEPTADHPAGEKAGIGGGLIWPAVGLVVSLAYLILQVRADNLISLPRGLWFIVTFQWLADAFRGARYLEIYLRPVIDLMHFLALIATPLIATLFFMKSRHIKRLMPIWLGAGILLTAVSITGAAMEARGSFVPFFSLSTFSLRAEIAPFRVDWTVEAMLVLVPSLLLIPVVSISISPLQFAVLIGWLVYFRHSRRVANTFTREITGVSFVPAFAVYGCLALTALAYFSVASIAFEEKDGHAIWGTEIKDSRRYGSLSSCGGSCLMNPACVAFEVRKSHGECTFYSKIEVVRPNSGFQSAMRRW